MAVVAAIVAVTVFDYCAAVATAVAVQVVVGVVAEPSQAAQPAGNDELEEQAAEIAAADVPDKLLQVAMGLLVGLLKGYFAPVAASDHTDAAVAAIADAGAVQAAGVAAVGATVVNMLVSEADNASCCCEVCCGDGVAADASCPGGCGYVLC